MATRFSVNQEDYIEALNELYDLAVAGGGGGGGTVQTVTGTAPISVSGTTAARTVAITPATTAAAGSMSAADKQKLDNLPTEFDGTGDVTMVGVQTLTNKTLTNPEFTIQTLTEPTLAWNAASGSMAKVTLTVGDRAPAGAAAASAAQASAT